MNLLCCRRPRLLPLLLLAAACLAVTPALAETLDNVISRENPKFHATQVVLTVGRDGKVYLASNDNPGYVLRLALDGAGKLGGEVIYALQNCAANADGIIATANAHFSHSVNLYSPTFEKLATVADFLVSDATGWDAPVRVEAGTGGDFYAGDQHRNRILRITPAGKLLTTYPLRPESEAAKDWGRLIDFRVCEKTQAFYWATGGNRIRCVGFDGTTRWSVAAAVGGDPWGGWFGGFDVDADGMLYILENTSDTVRRFAPDGKPAGETKLQLGERKGRVAALRLAGDAFVVQRPDPIELFQVYARADGALRNVVRAAAERVRVTVPDGPWTAGKTVPITIAYDGPVPDMVKKWRIDACPLGLSDWRAAYLTEGLDGSMRVAQSCAGLYQLRIDGPAPEYRMHTVFEVRQPDTKGTVSVFTANNRVYFARGEPIPVTIVVRCPAGSAPASLPLRLIGRGVEREIKCMVGGLPPAAAGAPGRPCATLDIPAEMTAQLPPGRYALTTDSAFTNVPQYIELGNGADAAWPFRITQYGDYGITFPVSNVWDFAEATEAHLERCNRLGLNSFVDRANYGFPLDFANDANGRPLLRALQERLAKDPLGTAPEKAEFGFAHAATLGGYSAAGLKESCILVNMDGGLPLGTGFDARKPEQFTENIRRYTEALKPFRSFYGWAWVANWWVYDDARRYASPAEKSAFDAAYKRAQDTGAWDPILDTVSARSIGWQVEAQEFFNKTLHEITRVRRTASSGPYRRPDTYPPESFANVDEVDIHYQCEQITSPNWVPHGVDWMKVPDKRAWVHPEVWNDSGTGEQILPMLWQAVMRGADGIGCSGNIPNWGIQPGDTRSAYAGSQSEFRAMFQAVRPYGSWLTTLENADPIAIVVSSRLAHIDRWAGLGGLYFSRLFEAYQSCLYAHRPARFVFPEYLATTPLTGFRAVLVVGQTVEFEPAMLAALRRAQAAGVPVFADGACRTELVCEFKPLGLAFDFVEHSHPMNNDTVYWSYPERFIANAAAMAKTLGTAVPPIAECAEPEVLLSERRDGGGRFLFVVNNAHCPLDPGVLWRYSLGIATRMPLVVPVQLNLKPGEAVYDVLARRELNPADATVSADLRYSQARIYAILPRRIERVVIHAPSSADAGATLTCTVRVQSSWRRAIAASVPVHFRAWTDVGGTLLDERFLSVTAAGTKVAVTVPTGKTGEQMHIEATELFSGQSARADVRIRGAEPTATPATQIGADTQPPALRLAADWFGSHLRDLAVSADGKTALVTAMDWDCNLYVVDTVTGQLRRSQRLGQYWTFAPQAAGDGFAVQACEFRSAPGYYLYRLDADGGVRDRCALPGVAKRLPLWFVPGMIQDRVNNFVASPKGTFAAACGNMGLAVWDTADPFRMRPEKPMWSQDWSQKERRTMPLAALGEDTLVYASGMTVTGADAKTGTERWKVTLATTGEIQGLVTDGATDLVVARASTEGGRVFALRSGAVVATFPTPADEVVIVPRQKTSMARFVAVTTGDQLKVYGVDSNGPIGTFTGDSPLHGLRASPDGQRLAVGSELGTLYVLDAYNVITQQRLDLGALPVPAWLPAGDLLVATWRGTLHRFAPNMAERWHVRLAGDVHDIRPQLLAAAEVPTRQPAAWTNNAATPWALTPNLLAADSAVVSFKLGDKGVEPQQKSDMLFDGKDAAPEKPWLPWYEIGMIDSGWKGSFGLEIDTFRRQLRVSAITFVEDAAHPESWLRDARLEYWDMVNSKWLFAQFLTADAAVHTHVLAKPIEAARFRLVRSDGYGWPQGNLRLAELVFHGAAIGPSHPDALAQRPAAVLFDEKEEDLRCLLSPPGTASYQYGGAAAGGMFIKVEADKLAGPGFQPPFGHAVPIWDFEIAEKTAPGQYRWLQFAAKAMAPETRGLTVRIGAEWPGPAVWLDLGEGVKVAEGVLVRRQLAAQPPRAGWQTYRVDLWALLQGAGKPAPTVTQPGATGPGAAGKPAPTAPRLRAIGLGTVGGPGAFDQVILGRTEADLPARP